MAARPARRVQGSRSDLAAHHAAGRLLKHQVSHAYTQTLAPQRVSNAELFFTSSIPPPIFCLSYSIATQGALTTNVDSWGGYRAERDTILAHIEENEINNVVILSGDSHATWVCELNRDNNTSYDSKTGKGALGVEFAGSAVSSPSSYGYGKGFTDPVCKYPPLPFPPVCLCLN